VGSVLSLLLVATGTTLRASEMTDITDPCKLVTAAEAEAVIGTPITSANEGHVKDPVKFPVRICMFHGKNGKALNVSTGIKTATEFDSAWAGHDAIPGVGEAAYSSPPAVITFRKGTNTVLFQAMNFDFSHDGRGHTAPDPKFAARLKTVALAAASRL
jgi:hypothetical protein